MAMNEWIVMNLYSAFSTTYSNALYKQVNYGWDQTSAYICSNDVCEAAPSERIASSVRHRPSKKIHLYLLDIINGFTQKIKLNFIAAACNKPSLFWWTILLWKSITNARQLKLSLRYLSSFYWTTNVNSIPVFFCHWGNSYSMTSTHNMLR